MVGIQPMSGYDIRKEIASSIGYFWHEGYGQIYPTLRRLAAEGMVAEKRAGGGRHGERTVFAITKKGRAHLKAWLARAPLAQTPRNEMLLKLFLGRLAPGASRTHVESFRAEQKKALALYSALEKELRKTQSRHPDLPFWLASVSYGQHLARALLSWSNETLRMLDGRDGHAGKEGAA
ncbi:MAG TPA: PadR family transcriptional regulator [Rhizomicrobium sp.]|nr:PadR family transcriptional regulator [Rhizomicrobium sp.]